jgi:hypothetical protein
MYGTVNRNASGRRTAADYVEDTPRNAGAIDRDPP